MTTFFAVLILSAGMFSAGVCIGAFLTWKKNRKEQRDIADYINRTQSKNEMDIGNFKGRPFPGSHDDDF